MLPVEADMLHRPLPGLAIPASEVCQVTLTGFQGHQRQIILAMMRWMGVEVQKNMALAVTTHVVAKDVEDTTSQKLNVARKPEYAHRISIVNVDWVYDSLRQWTIQPSANYLRNKPPPESPNPQIVEESGSTGKGSQQRTRQCLPGQQAGSQPAASLQQADVVLGTRSDDFIQHAHPPSAAANGHSLQLGSGSKAVQRRASPVQMTLTAALGAAVKHAKADAAEPAAASQLKASAVQQPSGGRQSGLPWGSEVFDPMAGSIPSDLQIAAANARTAKLLSELVPPSAPTSPVDTSPGDGLTEPAAHRQHAKQADVRALLAARVCKEFDGGEFKGQVIGYDPVAKFYMVEFEDGDREEMSSQELQADRPGRRPFFALSGMHSDEQARCTAILKQLSVGVISGKVSHRWESRVTHVVMPSLMRSGKTLAGLAAGNWILGSSYLDECQSARRLIEEEQHELQESETGLIASGAPMHWRQRRDETGHGAFYGLRVVVHGTLDKTGPDRDHIVQIVEAGGGSVVGLAEAVGSRGAHVAVIKATKAKGDAGVKKLLAVNIACVAPQWVVQWVADPWGLLEKHRLFGSKASSELAEFEKGRGVVPPAMEVSQVW
ncbi:hypothetical protein WJX72_012276 [[Myrmecia] bisecta]|uniref:BRCT domain-containing protein n=1 Tax=[Myrmecia] bisecta TaxID=41462 RepID=A0AAW1QTR8_9CHLO